MSKRMGNALYAWHTIKSAADLPQESGEYLVTMCDGPIDAPLVRYIRIARYDSDDKAWKEERLQAGMPAAWAWDRGRWYRVVAWRPLPKPYEGEA